MAYRWKNTLQPRDATPQQIFFNRRAILGALAAGAAVSTLPHGAGADTLAPNPWEDITQYNNFYEFGTDKSDPAKYAGALTTSPWPIVIDGLVERPGTFDVQEIVAQMTEEERIYRFRCVEAWSMVVPWMGFELADMLTWAGVLPEARYVAFETLLRPEEMRGQRFRTLDWPYVEGLRLDEAMHPLTLMATGLYGKPMPKQNGAPLRLVVPWKYGFKSIKSIVRITLTKDEPPSSWALANPREYGFYSNVNPNVDHPRWSQATERRIGQGLFARRTPTLMFNGYEEDVAGLYAGMDLQKHF